MFKVKWEGYNKKSDQTWEPEDSLRYANQVHCHLLATR